MATSASSPSSSPASPAPSLAATLTEHVAGWPVGSVGVVVVDAAGTLADTGDVSTRWPWASVTKVLTALTVLLEVHDGVVGLDEPAGPSGSTVRHLLAHASGVAFDDDRVLSPPGRRRIYSNRGVELVAEHVERRTAQGFASSMRSRVLDPLGLTDTSLEGSPAHGARGPVADLAALARELLDPRVLPPAVVGDATTVAFPALAGVLPGFGRQDPNDWGLGCEVRGAKSPHWTAPQGSPRTFGHFGQSGSFLWVDPDAGVGCVCAGDTAFGPWAAQHWPRLAEAVLRHPDRRR